MSTDPTPSRQDRLRALWTDPLGVLAIRCAQLIVVVILAVAIVSAGLAIKTVVISLIIALILAAAFFPLTRLLERVHVPNALAALITLLVVIGVLAGLLTVVGFAIAGQAGALTSAVSDGITQLQSFLRSIGLPIDGKQVQTLISEAGSYLTSASFGSSALSGLSVAGNIATGVVLIVVIDFFFLRDGRRIWMFLIAPLTKEWHARAERIGASAVQVLGAYVRGTALVALVDSTLIGVGLLIVGVPLALPLAVLVFVTAFIPVVGATLAGIVAALVALVFNGPIAAVIVIGIVIVVNQVDGNLLQPLIMGRSLSVHPLVILLALTAGTILGGVIGAVLSTPTASVVWTAMKAWRTPPSGMDQEEEQDDPRKRRPGMVTRMLRSARRTA